MQWKIRWNFILDNDTQGPREKTYIKACISIPKLRYVGKYDHLCVCSVIETPKKDDLQGREDRVYVITTRVPIQACRNHLLTP